MKNISIDEFVKCLSNSDTIGIKLYFKGTIEFNISIELFNIKKFDDSIEIVNKKTSENINLNLHQIKKVISDEQGNFKILFDEPQRLIISIDN